MAIQKDTQFKKGHTPWSKGKKRPEMTGKNHPNWKGVTVCPQCNGKKSGVSIACMKCSSVRRANKMLGNKNCLGYKHTNEAKEKMREFRIAHPEMIKKDTKIELLIEEELIKNGITYQKQTPLCGRFLVDFYIPELKIVIQCDGCYWHGCICCRSLSNRILKDAYQNLFLKENDYTVFRFWEHDIKENAEDCFNKVLKFINK